MSLLSFLSSALGGNVAPATPQQQTMQPQPQQDDYPTLSIMGSVPKRTIAEDTRSPPSQRSQRELIQNKGAFGQKGTLRDILGAVGDALLLQSGHNQIYAPKREQEKLSSAMYGFTDNPMEAIERVGLVNPKAAETMYQNVLASQAKGASTDLARQQAADKRYEASRQAFGAYMGSANPSTYERIKPLLQAAKTRGQLGDEFVIPDKFDSELAHTYQYGAMPATQQIRTDQNEEKIKQTKQIADMNEAGRNKRWQPRAQPQPRATNPTAASMAQPIIDKVGKVGWGGLSPNEKDQLKSLGFNPDRGSKKSGLAGLQELLNGGGSQTPAPQANKQQPRPAPKVGEIRNGYRYMGGKDPGNPSNWKKV